MIFESRLPSFDEDWRLVVIRGDGVFFIGGPAGLEKADMKEEFEWREMPPSGNPWWKRVR